MTDNYWEKYYTMVLLDRIPWQRTQADWRVKQFKNLGGIGLVVQFNFLSESKSLMVDDGTIKGKTALYLGLINGLFVICDPTPIKVESEWQLYYKVAPIR